MLTWRWFSFGWLIIMTIWCFTFSRFFSSFYRCSFDVFGNVTVCLCHAELKDKYLLTDLLSYLLYNSSLPPIQYLYTCNRKFTKTQFYDNRKKTRTMKINVVNVYFLTDFPVASKRNQHCRARRTRSSKGCPGWGSRWRGKPPANGSGVVL